MKENNPAIMAKILVKTILLCYFAFLVIILYQNLNVFLSIRPFCAHHYLGVLVICVGIIWLTLKINLPDKLYIAVIVLLSLIPRLLFLLFIQTPITGDFLITYEAAQQAVTGDTSWLEAPFFTTWGYQIPFVYYQAFILRIFGSDLALKLFNVAFMVGTNILIYKIARVFATPNAALAGAMLYAIYPAPILLTTVLTNQHLSLMLLMLGIYFYVARPGRYHALFSGVFLCLGNLIRPEGVLVIGAMILHMLVTMNRDKLKGKTFIREYRSLLLIVLVYVLLNQASAFLLKATGAAPHGISNNCPEWKFVLGLDTESKGTYNEKNCDILTIRNPGERFEKAKEAIFQSLRSSNSLISFLGDKIKIMWANMESTTWSMLHIQRSRPVWNEIGTFTFDNALNIIIYTDKTIYIFMYSLLITACVILWRRPVSENQTAFFFIGLILLNQIVYLLIEIQTRYRYFIMPFFFIASSVVFDAVKKKLDGGWDIGRNRLSQ